MQHNATYKLTSENTATNKDFFLFTINIRKKYKSIILWLLCTRPNKKLKIMYDNYSVQVPISQQQQKFTQKRFTLLKRNVQKLPHPSASSFKYNVHTFSQKKLVNPSKSIFLLSFHSSSIYYDLSEHLLPIGRSFIQ